VGLTFAAPPAFAAEASAAAPAAAAEPLAAAAAAMVEALPVPAVAQATKPAAPGAAKPASTPAEGKSFFKTPTGIVSLVLLGGALGAMAYSFSHGRVKSPAK
jgi:hypothetical protein